MILELSNSKHNDSVMRVEIPKELHQAIIRIQADETLDFVDACRKAALLVDPRREEYRKAVEDEANRLAKSRFMKQINKARKTIEDQAYQRGADYVRNSEDNFHTPCSVCGKPIHFSNSLSNWEDVRKPLHEAFSKWYHGNCKQQ